MPFITQGKTNWKFLLIVIILAIIVGGGAFIIARQEFPVISYFIFPKSCQSIHNGIEKEFEEANFCNQDTDCKVISLGGPYIEFGCYKFVNVNTDEAKLMEKVKAYDIKCGPMIDKCAVVSKVVCISNKCVPAKDETADWKTYKSEKYGFEVRYPKDWIISKNILGAFNTYKNFEKYRCSVEIYANKDKYLYPLEESNNYFQGFSESQISIKPEEASIGNISATKISSDDLSGREIYFLKKKIEDREYYLNIFLDVTDLRYKYDVIVKNHDCKEIFNRIISTFSFPENISAKDLFNEPICKYRRAQFEMRIYDTQGRITGVLDGKIKEEIPGSYCTQDKETNETIIDLPSYAVISKLEVFGITDGNYEFSINGPNPEEPYDYVGVEGKDIPIVSGVLHHFEFDWKGLSEGKEAVAILIDTNNDGIFEKTVLSDNNLSCEEFIIQLKES